MAFMFMQITLAALCYGLANVIPAFILQKEAEEIKAGANELDRGEAAAQERKRFVSELMRPAWKDGALPGLMMGLFVAVAAYDMAGVIAAAGQRMWAGFADRIAKQYTISAILGNGSPVMGAVVLGSIVLGVMCAKVGACAGRQAQENWQEVYEKQ